ncbi:variable large family protein (plasmid) [Borrelia coriaceae]|uniref:Variable large protein n=1 Tax=Borrelia coriaceae ATCC 43381 TaxID=1408429 RepID=W5T269_9SPIR|nr:variable large family protein [Borrelia coriaceae]AHH11376.1 Variable major protein [Borrelia coriaceae ATCC 43381]UPA17503.1 variable large family protein [Borrelia coriaceae]
MKINIKNIRLKRICATLFISLFLACNNGVIEELEKRKSFADSLINIGHNFQEIFTSFGNAMGDALGFSAVTSDDKRSKVGEHFKTIGNGLTETKKKLDDLSKNIASTSYADTKGIEAVNNAIKRANDVFDNLTNALTKLFGAVGNTPIGDTGAAAAVPAEVTSVKDIIEGVKVIVEAAINSGVKIAKGNSGSAVEKGNTAAPAALNAASSAAGSGATAALAVKVSEADPWAMIDKIKDATTSGLGDANDNNAGQLATANASDNNGAKAATTADLAAAVALKAMTKTGKFSHAASEDNAVKAAAVSSVNKVLGVLDLIIRQTVLKKLEKVREAVKGITYSDTAGEADQGGSIQTTVTKK